jgi:predicted DCC family thiol-disulfide oxidoreductase YuxK
MQTMVVIEQAQVYQRSDAVLRVAGHLPGVWPALKVFKAVPRGVRDRLYNVVAKSRYKWFGKRESCWLPTADLRKRFLN